MTGLAAHAVLKYITCTRIVRHPPSLYHTFLNSAPSNIIANYPPPISRLFFLTSKRFSVIYRAPITPTASSNRGQTRFHPQINGIWARGAGLGSSSNDNGQE